ncbi:hypothetical protein B0T10DRAFT_572511 [Thelonectria olida]|uniref:Uncharacterized protein n=1 Tax=Thelonectria olida TaxID=1576542 RepID=A0A9P8W350_9HYPO|nr:hypothetical protein B0T10DRAFT_572511 [Thelonectria olida]
MEPNRGSIYDQNLGFDWDPPILNVEDENKSWREQVDKRGGVTNPAIDLFLDIPVHSPRSRYQLNDEFKAIGLDVGLDNLKERRFSRSTLWLYDSDGKQGRGYNGVMTAEKAIDCLRLKRFHQEDTPDASVRRFHIHHPTPESMGVLILNSELTESRGLRDFFWNHIRGQSNKASIRFNIGDGVRQFSLTYHVPTFVLRTAGLEEDILEDCRKKVGERPWRKSRKLLFLSTGSESDEDAVPVLHESQHSFTVYGPSKGIWKSIALADTYFYKRDPENPDTVEYYADYPDEEASNADHNLDSDSDPDESDSESDVEPEVWDPSMLGTIEARMWLEEWWNIFTIVQSRVENHLEAQSATIVKMPTSRDSAQKALKDIERNRQWAKQTQELLELLIRTLRAIITSWQVFIKDDDLVYVPKTRRLQYSIQQIKNKFKELEDVLDLFVGLENQCHQFRKTLELDTGALNMSFMQVISPVAVSAAILQAGVFPGKQFIWFIAMIAGFFALSWHMEPLSSPLPRLFAKVMKAYGELSGAHHHESPHNGTTEDSSESSDLRHHQPFQAIFRRMTGFSDFLPPRRAIEPRDLEEDGYRMTEFGFTQGTLRRAPAALIR